MNVPLDNMSVALPLIVACAWGLLVLVAEMFSSGKRFTGIGWLTIVGLAVVGGLSYTTGITEVTFAGALALDGFASYFNLLLCGLAVLAVLMSIDYVPASGIVRGEYYPLLLFAVAGLLVMVAATDLIVMFLGLETMSMAVYVLAGVHKAKPRSNEASLKYFLMGAFASALLLYGIALLYTITGSTVLGDIATALQTNQYSAADRLVLDLALGLLLIGFGFKIAAVPFHLWTPDVYEGAPSSVTVFMATAVKAGAFAALIRTVPVALLPLLDNLTPLLWVAAAVTMTVGNFAALRQTSLKRMLAYSSIAHTGYLLVGLTAGTADASAAVLFYLTVYGVMNMGAFGVMIAVARRDEGCEEISHLAGLSRNHPMLAAAMTVCMLSLMGMPPLGGFIGKFYVFAAAVEAGYVGLVVIAVLNSVVSAVYYLGVVRAMYFESGGLELEGPRPYAAVAVGGAAIATVLLGVVPTPILGAASRALQAVVLGP